MKELHDHGIERRHTVARVLKMMVQALTLPEAASWKRQPKFISADGMWVLLSHPRVPVPRQLLHGVDPAF